MYQFDLEEYLQDLATVVNIDTGKYHAVGTNTVADFFVEKYKALGLIVEKKYHDGFEAAPFVTARNSDSEHIDVLFLAHMDTVFPEGTAAERPFHIDENGHGRGPGCADCKGGCVSTYYLIRKLMESHECHFNFCVALNSDEEMGSKHSRGFIEELAKKSDRCFVMEPGRPLQEYVQARKCGINYTIKCHGIAAHSGNEPEKGANAILELSHWVVELYKFFNLAEGTTVNVARLNGGDTNGHVPDYAEMKVGVRCLYSERIAEIDETVKKMAEHPFDPRCTIEINRNSGRPPLLPHEKSKEMLDAFQKIGEEMDFPVTYLTVGGGSDGNFTSALGVATIDGCGPAGGNLHTEDEFLILDTIEKRIEIIRKYLLKMYS